MKKVGCGCLGAIAFIGVLVIVLLIATGGLVDTVDAFFLAINEGRPEEAYTMYTSSDFKNNVDSETFAYILDYMPLGEYESASWTNREIKNDLGVLTGTITTVRGDELPATIQFQKENGDWLILHINVNLTTLRDEPLEALVKNQMQLLADAINKGDFTEIYEKSSGNFRETNTVESFKSAFAVFIEKGIDLSIVKDREMVLSDDGQKLADNGLLEVKGSFPGTPFTVQFQMGFYFEEARWKMVSIDINIPE